MTSDSTSPAAPTLALLSHELRTPLTALIGFADAMQLQTFGPLAAPYDEYASIIHRAARHLLAIVDQISEVTRTEAGAWSNTPERFDPATLLEELIALLEPRAAAAGVTLGGAHSTGGSDVVADRRALTQILLNLLDNALKFTGAGGEIRVDLMRDGGDLQLTVTNTGPRKGATPLPSPAEGAGLGLRIVRALCAQQKGTLTITNHGEGGHRATVHLAVFPET